MCVRACMRDVSDHPCVSAHGLVALTGTDYVCNGSKLVEVTTTIEDNFKWEKIFDAFYFATYTWTTGNARGWRH